MLSAGIKDFAAVSPDALQSNPYVSPPQQSFDLKAVGFLNELLYQGSDVTMLPAYLAGGLAFRALRLGAVGNWVASPAVKTLSSLFTRQVGASALALGGEVAAFTGAHRLAVSLVKNAGGIVPPSELMGTEMAGTAITLALLRSFGFGFGMLGGLLQRSGLAGAATQGMLSTLGSYTGLLTAAQAEHRLLHPEIPQTGNPFFNAAVSLVHFTVANLAANHFTPSAWRHLETSLEQKTYRLLSEKAEQIRNSFPTSLDGGLVWARVGVENASSPTTSKDLKTQGIYNILNSSGISESTPPHDSQSSEPNLEEFWASLPDHQRGMIHNIFQLLSVGNENLTKTMAESRWVGDPRFDLALKRLHHLMKYTPSDGSQSWYINWITRLGLERILENADSEALDEMIEKVTEPTTRLAYETFLSQHLPEGSFPIKTLPKKLNFWPFNESPHVSAIEDLSLGPKAKEVLHLWLLNQSKETSHTPFLIPQEQFLVHLKYLAEMKDPVKWSFTEEIIERAKDNPLSRLHLYRLFQILHTQMKWKKKLEVYTPRGWLGTKIRELRDKNFRIAEELPGDTFSGDNFGHGAKGGYLGFNGPDRLLRPMLHQLRELMRPEEQEARLKKRQDVLREFLVQHPGREAYSLKNLAKAFSLLSEAFKGENWEFNRNGKMGDFSFHAAQDLKPDKFHLELHTPESYEARYRQILKAHDAHKRRPHEGPKVVHIPQGKIIHYSGSFEIPGIGKKSLILIVRSDKMEDLAPEDLYFAIMTTALHELAHDWQAQDYSQGARPTNVISGQIKQEAATHTTDNWFQVQGGDIKVAYIRASEGLGGYMMRCLDYIEGTYKKHWDE